MLRQQNPSALPGSRNLENKWRVVMPAAAAKAVLAAAAAWMILAPAAALSQQLTCTFLDRRSKPMKDVEVRLVRQAVEPAMVQRKSGKDGRVVFNGLEEGVWLLQAQFGGYLPVKITVRIPEDREIERTLLKPKEMDSMEQAALEAFEKGDAAKAIGGLTELLGYYPEDAGLHGTLGRIYAEIGEDEKALAEAEKVVQLDPRSAAVKVEIQKTLVRNMARAALKAEDFKSALQKFGALRDLDPADPTAYEGLALAHGHLGELDAALVAIDVAIRLDPGNESLLRIKQILAANASVQ